jgi:hypothetical protein
MSSTGSRQSNLSYEILEVMWNGAWEALGVVIDLSRIDTLWTARSRTLI